MADPQDIVIRPMLAADARRVAEMHVEEIRQGFLASLGHRVLTRIYRALPEAAGAFGFVADKAGWPEGFITGAADLRSLYRAVLWRQWLPLSALMLPRLFTPRVVRRVLETLCYPRKMDREDLPPAEVLSVVTSPALRGQGAGGRLMRAAFDEFRRRRCGRVKVLVGANLEPANSYYRRLGFRLIETIEHHGRPENVYVIDLDADCPPRQAGGGQSIAGETRDGNDRP